MTHIDPEGVDNLVVIHINGSSKYAVIKPFQQLFNQNAIGEWKYIIISKFKNVLQGCQKICDYWIKWLVMQVKVCTGFA